MNDATRTLLVSRSLAASLASSRDYLDAMQEAFAALARGEYTMPEVGHIACDDGAFHIKAARRTGGRQFAVVKVNGNFPANAARHGLPTIQGFVALLDAERGSVLALMDSIEITARRTAAATALAARHLARADSSMLGLVGCGVQARYHVEALRDVAQLRVVRYADPRDEAARAFGAWLEAAGLEGFRVKDARVAAAGADIVVTLTTSARPVLTLKDVADGTFVAGVGADSPSKHELAPDLLAGSRVVVDLLSQTSVMGDLSHAIASGAMTPGDIHGELADVVSGRVPGRTEASQRFVFDSTGMALQDLAAATMLVERARAREAYDRNALYLGR